MSDIAEQNGMVFDIVQLSRLLEARIVRTVGNKGKGKTELLDAIIETAEQDKRPRRHKINYGEEIEHELERIERLVADKENPLTQKYDPRWLAVKLLEHDDDITAKIQSRNVLDAVTASVEHLKDIFRDNTGAIWIRAPHQPFPWWGPPDPVNAVGRALVLLEVLR